MVVGPAIVRRHLIKRRGTARGVPSFASWLASRIWLTQYRQNYGASGLPSRLQVGSNARSPKRRTNRCPTKRYTEAFIYRPEVS